MARYQVSCASFRKTLCMSQSWFLHSNNLVTGPFSTVDVKSKIASGKLAPDTMIWWKGQREWAPISFWQEHIETILDSVAMQTQNAIWTIYQGKTQIGPLSKTDLISKLKGLPDLAGVMLWARGMQEPISLFEVHDVMELIGINRRDFERRPLMAQVGVSRLKRDPKEFQTNAASIGEGGIGIVGQHDLKRGDEVGLAIETPALGGTLVVRGEVSYVTEQGYAGIRFVKLTAEAVAVIHDYVRKFENPGNKAA